MKKSNQMSNKKKLKSLNVLLLLILAAAALGITYPTTQALRVTDTFDQTRASQAIITYPHDILGLNFWKLNIPTNSSEIDGNPDEITNEGKPGQPNEFPRGRASGVSRGMTP